MTGLMNSATGEDAVVPAQLCHSTAAAEAELTPAVAPDPDAWRREVAARLARYRTRRKPRSPRYPSLLLPFDASDNWTRPAPAPTPFLARNEASREDSLDCEAGHGAADQARAAAADVPHFDKAEPAPLPDLPPEPSAKVIEFPRSAAIPVFHSSPLADPIFDRPRIVEAPEVVPPPPALGGILIEPFPQETADQRAAAECLLQIASIPRRLLAMALDGLIQAIALGAFAAIFWRLNPVRGPLPVLAVVACAIAVLLWMAYQFLFVVYIGTTPGLRAARLRLAKFDSSPINRRTRRWRVLASFLSAFSAGLGYLWCFLDQDSLCWHDRISRTYMRFVPPAD